MKKLFTILLTAVLLAGSLTACGSQESSFQTPKMESPAILEAAWPENEYTAGLPVPPGTVSWAMLDDATRCCAVNLTGLTDDEFTAYLAELKENGFSVTHEVSEEVRGEDDVSTGILMNDGNVSLSISHIPDNLAIYISLNP